MTASPLPDYRDPCGWNALLPARTPNLAASGAIRAKYAVVGAGFTGLAAARRLAELDPGAEIVVLEGTTIGEGSSGRNSGFAAKFDVKAGLSTAEAARAQALNRFSSEGFEALETATREGGFDCDLHRSGRILAAATEAGETKAREALAGAQAHGVESEWLDREGLKRWIGSGYYRAAARTAEGYLLQPAALVRGLADSLPANVTLFENSPVTEIEGESPHVLRTPQAQISADHVILAVNAAIKHFGFWRDRLVVIYTYAALTEEMGDAELASLGAPNWGVLPAHRLGSTLRRVGARRLMVRSLYAYERTLDSADVRVALTDRLRRRFPQLGHVSIEYIWGGTTALTMNGSPRWGRIGKGLYGSAGCNGSGIVKGTTLGRRLAEMIVTGDPQEALRAAYGTADWIAPEPFRTIGFRTISAWERRKAGAEM
jgi:glycine/D-amino acid oxidase-like deaminating enzyme